MKKLALALFFLLAPWLFASGFLKNIEIFKRTERIDILFTFEKSFDEKITQHSGKGYHTITLKNTPFTGTLNEEMNILGIDEIRIFGEDGNLHIMVMTNTTPMISASKTADGFGLRVRIKEASATPSSQNDSTKEAQNRQNSAVLFKEDTQTDFLSRGEYLGFIAFLSAILLFLLFVRKRIASGKGMNATLIPWSFGAKSGNPNEIKIISQKAIDIKNRFVTIESHGYYYLILLGASGSTLIDRYPISSSDKEDSALQDKYAHESFERLLEQKKEHLLHYLASEPKGREYPQLKK